MKTFVLRASRGPTEDGFVIVAVLWMLGALATLASVYALYVSNTALTSRVIDDRLQADALVSAALDLTAYRLSSVGHDPRPRHGAFRLRMGRADVAVAFRAESARIDLNAAPKALLAGLFATLGTSSANADSYADRIVAWRTKKTPSAADAEVSAYRMAGLPYGPRFAPFQNVGELSLVRGLPPGLVGRALPFLTVFNGQPDVDILIAAPEVVAALPGMTPGRLHDVLAQRVGVDPDNAQAVLGLPGPAQGAATTTGRDAVRVSLSIAFDNGRRVKADGVILMLDNGDEPFRVLSWHDDFDGPG